MKIHKDLLTHDGATVTGGNTVIGKTIDLGFNGDFDRKKTDWNLLFIHVPATSGGSALTVKAYSKQSEIYDSNGNYILVVAASPNTNLIATATISADKVQKGGVFAIQMPRGLKRYFTLTVTAGQTPPGPITAGITDEVDTDLELDWTNYKAATGTSEVRQKSENVGEVIAGTVHAAINS